MSNVKYKSVWVTLVVVLFIALTAMDTRNINKPESAIGPSTPLSDVLILLGDKKPSHYLKAPDATLIEKGRQIVFDGNTIGPDGKKTSKVSRFFACIHCHNTVIEDPDLTKSNPDTRLDFVIAQSKSLLPATTFY